MKNIRVLLLLLVASSFSQAQQILTSDLLEKEAFRFSLNEDHSMSSETREVLASLVGDKHS